MTKILNSKPVCFIKNDTFTLYDKAYFHHENTKFVFSIFVFS